MKQTQVRPSRIAAAAIKAAAQQGMEVEIRPDGTITVRPMSPKSTAPRVAPKREIRL
jgi:hypothetical protein